MKKALFSLFSHKLKSPLCHFFYKRKAGDKMKKLLFTLALLFIASFLVAGFSSTEIGVNAKSFNPFGSLV
jgi:hypothetical protein